MGPPAHGFPWHTATRYETPKPWFPLAHCNARRDPQTLVSLGTLQRETGPPTHGFPWHTATRERIRAGIIRRIKAILFPIFTKQTVDVVYRKIYYVESRWYCHGDSSFTKQTALIWYTGGLPVFGVKGARGSGTIHFYLSSNKTAI